MQSENKPTSTLKTTKVYVPVRVEVGDKSFKSMTAEELLQVVLIEQAHVSLDYWNVPVITNFDNKMFHDTLVLDYHSYRTRDNLKSKDFVLFFNYEDFTFHYTMDFENDPTNQGMKRSNRIKIETIKYLIKQGYNLPIY